LLEKRKYFTGHVDFILSRFVSEFDTKTVKDTETVQRLKVHYRHKASDLSDVAFLARTYRADFSHPYQIRRNSPSLRSIPFPYET
jgi:hypothetical protein